MVIPPKNIAIIDDDHGVRRAVARLLTAAGYTVYSFGSAREFFETGIEGVFACFVVDIDLGEELGLEVARNPTVLAKRVPVIFMTASASEEARREAIRAGSRCLIKPFRSEDLLGAIAGAISETELVSSR